MTGSTFEVSDAVLDDLRTWVAEHLMAVGWWRVRGGREEPDLDYLRELVRYWHIRFRLACAGDCPQPFQPPNACRRLASRCTRFTNALPTSGCLPPCCCMAGPIRSCATPRCAAAAGRFPSGCALTSRLWLLGHRRARAWSSPAAGAIAELMTASGYDRFVVQCGDVGASAAEQLARRAHRSAISAASHRRAAYTHLFSVDPAGA